MFKFFKRTKGYASSSEILLKFYSRRLLGPVIAGLSDRRQIFECVSSALKIPEYSVIERTAARMQLGLTESVQIMDIEALRGKYKVDDLRRCGAIARTSHGMLTGFFCVDPALLWSLVQDDPLFEKSTEVIVLAPWKVIARALDQSEKQYLQSLEERKQKVAFDAEAMAQKVFELVLQDVKKHGGSGFEIETDKTDAPYHFQTASGKTAAGSIDRKMKDSVIAYVEKRALVQDIKDIRIELLPSRDVIRVTFLGLHQEVVVTSVEPVSVMKEKSFGKFNRIMLIDDNHTFVSILQRFFDREGVESISVESCEKALQLLSQQLVPPNLIICDVHMPGMNGFQFAENLKEHPLLSSIPLIMLTSDTDIETELRLVNSGADAFISKTDDPRLLYSHVKRLLN